MKQRMGRGTFSLTPDDIKSFLANDESASAIGKRKGAPSSLVSYHLRKMNDPKINEMLKLNANRNHLEFKNNRLAKVEQMIEQGKPAHEIMDVCHVGTATLTRVRRDMGLADPRRISKPRKRKVVTGQPISEIKSLLDDVLETPIFTALTKKWPVNLECAQGEVA